MNDPSFNSGRFGLAVGALFLFLSPLQVAAAPGPGGHDIVGVARVVDGDTIDVAGERIRLEGIDAPETGQSCQTAGGQAWPCGKVASEKLRTLIGKSTVSCSERGRDRYDRVLAYCSAGDVALNEAMVASGYAWAFVKYSRAFVSVEAAARDARIGVWQGSAQAPWDYRAGAWQVAESAAPKGCAIKGNISDQGYIYHLPWSPWYAKVRVDTGRGERWFCSEAEAIDAGWRPAAAN